MIFSPFIALTLAYGTTLTPDIQDDRAVFAKLFPHATGQNGLEDYVKAGDLLNDSAFIVYQYWLPADRRPSPGQTRMAEEARRKLLASMTPEERRGAEQSSAHLSPDDQELADRLDALNYLQTRQDEVKHYQRSLDLLAQGNQKEFEYPQISLDVIANPDGLVSSRGRQLSRLAADAAFVAYSNGQSHEGTKLLSQALVMAHRLGSADVPCRMASRGTISILLASLDDHLGSLSSPDADALAILAANLLNDRAETAKMIRGERRRMAAIVDRALKSGLMDQSPQGETSSIARQFEGLSADQRQAFADKLHQTVNERYDALTQRFDSPEENWISTREPQAVAPPDPQNLDQLAAALARAFTALAERDLMLAVMQTRTQLRLMRLHALIIQFRWQTGRLPNNLDELKLSRDDLYDPLSRGVFKYLPDTTTYKLSSPGIPETGEIQLRYEAPADRSTKDPDRP